MANQRKDRTRKRNLKIILNCALYKRHTQSQSGRQTLRKVMTKMCLANASNTKAGGIYTKGRILGTKL